MKGSGRGGNCDSEYSTSALAAGNHVLAETNDKPHNLFIFSKEPIYLSCEKTDGNESRWHAFVLRGYDTSVGAYSIWNPWDAKYISMSYFSKSISAGGGKYIWEKTIYGW